MISITNTTTANPSNYYNYFSAAFIRCVSYIRLSLNNYIFYRQY